MNDSLPGRGQRVRFSHYHPGVRTGASPCAGLRAGPPVIGEFTARRVQGLRPRIQEIVDERIDAILDGGPPADRSRCRGVRVREGAGEGVIISLLAANHDPAAFPDPGTLDPAGRIRQHVAFGSGPHQCLGQSLARAELEIVYRTLFQRIPGPRLAIPLNELPVKDDAFVYGLQELPITW